MLRQIALALLALFLTLPAAAAPLCHAPAAASAPAEYATMDHASMGHAMPAPTDDDRQPSPANQHGCLGCAAPAATAPEPVSAALPPHAAPALPARKLIGIAAAPALRPPQP